MEGGGQYARVKRSVEDVFHDFRGRRAGLLKALTDDFERFYQECDPEKDTLCLFGLPTGSWEVKMPDEDVPPDFPEPTLGINFQKEGMPKSDWISLVAIHSDAWLISLAFHFGALYMFDKDERMRLFQMINELPTLFEIVAGRKQEQLSTNQNNENNNQTKWEDDDDALEVPSIASGIFDNESSDAWIEECVPEKEIGDKSSDV